MGDGRAFSQRAVCWFEENAEDLGAETARAYVSWTRDTEQGADGSPITECSRSVGAICP